MTERIDSHAVHISLKAMTWERAKGELRALVAIRGSVFGSETDPDTGLQPYEASRNAIEAFIKDFEGNGLHE